MTDWEMLKAEITKDPAGLGYAGKTPEQVAILLTTPRQVRVDLRGLNAEEVYDALTPTTTAKLAGASLDHAAATNDAQRATAAAGVVLDTRLSNIGGIEVAPGTMGRTILDNAVAAGYLTATERDALLVKARVPVLERRIVTAFGWGPDTEVTAADVTKAMGG